MSGRELDEDDVRVKRGRRTRPRSKQRPAHDDAVDAFVVTIDRGRITCALSASPTVEVVAVKARELGRTAVSAGDNVGLAGDLGIVVAVADPPPRIGLIDRCLVAAYDARVDPLLVLTKVDLGDPAELLAAYRDLDIPAVAVTRGGSLAELSDCLRDRVSVFVGHSGVGKSTLVNALIPDAKRATGGVNESTGRGRHTSTSAQALALPFGGWLIDTPGVRSFGLAHVERQRVIDAFDDLAEGTANCPRSCSHDEVDCGLDLWCEQGHASAARLESLRRILRAIDDAH